MGRRRWLASALAAILLCAAGVVLWVRLSGPTNPVDGAWTGIPGPANTSADGFATFGDDFSVDCPSQKWCMVVGPGGFGASATGRAEVWDGERWSAVAISDYTVTDRESTGGTGTTTSYPADVDCTSPTWCIALAGRLVESWDGHVWSDGSLFPGNLPADYVGLADVDCASPTWCVLVSTSGQSGVVDTWNGQAWSVAPGLDTSSTMERVDCVSTSWCVAVGGGNGMGGGTPRVETWDGRSWSMAEAPSGGADGDLTGVSCLSDTSGASPSGVAGREVAPVRSRNPSWRSGTGHRGRSPRLRDSRAIPWRSPASRPARAAWTTRAGPSFSPLSSRSHGMGPTGQCCLKGSPRTGCSSPAR